MDSFSLLTAINRYVEVTPDSHFDLGIEQCPVRVL
jgi:hypothetical protein